MENLLAEDRRYILNLYKRMELTVDKATGSYLVDHKGNRFLDMVGGIAVNGLGYAHSGIRAAILQQLDQYIHLSNFFVSPAVVGLARQLVEHSFASKVFFTNSGTEAIEAALKLARKYGKSVAPGKVNVVALHKSFHGRTYGGMSLTGQPKYQEPFSPVVPGIKHVELNSLDDLRRNVSDETCAIFLEMIQGEGGVRPLAPEFLAEVGRLSKKHKCIVVADEIQTGLGRTGDLFAYQHYDFTPDIMALGKLLGGGLPLGAMLVSRRLEEVLVPGDHGSTFGGNPVACAAGQAVLRTVTQESFLQGVKAKSTYLIDGLEKVRHINPRVIRDIRGRGLMLGVEAGEHAPAIQSKALERGILLNVTSGTVIRLLPPLTIGYEELDVFLTGLSDAIARL